MVRHMTRAEAGLVPVTGHRSADHRGQACAHWSASKKTPRSSRALIADKLEKPKKPGIKWYKLWRNPATAPLQRANLSRKISAYNRARAAYNKKVRPDPAELKKLDAQAAAIWRGFQAFHMKGHGWDDIGYHKGVFAHGLIIDGRPVGSHGIHAGPEANWMLGVCFVMGPGDKVSPEMVEAAEEIERVHNVKLDHAHFDFMATACPGRGWGSITHVILGRGPDGGPR